MHRLTALLLAWSGIACADRADNGANVPTWTVADTPSVVIGTVSGEDGHDLNGVLAATRLSDGRVVIADRGTHELRFFTPDGVLAKRAGGRGGGPGEMQLMQHMQRLPGDTLLVFAFRPGLLWFTAEGEFVRQESIDPTALRRPCLGAESGLVLIPTGELLLTYEYNSGAPGCLPTTDGVSQRQGMVARFDGVTARFDSLASLPATERNGIHYRVFGRMLMAAGGVDRIFVAESGSDSILVFRLGESESQLIPTPFPSVPVPDAAKSEKNRRIVMRGGGQQIVTESAYDYPDVYPRWARMLVDTEGLLWVMQYPEMREPATSGPFALTIVSRVPEGGATWRVVDHTGRVHANVATPAGVFPLEIGHDYVLGLRKDDLDVQSVGLYALIRDSTSGPGSR